MARADKLEPVAVRDAGVSGEARDYHCTTAEAVRLVKQSYKPGMRYYTHVRAPAHIQGDAEHVYRDGCWGSVGLSYKEALRLAENLLSPQMEAKGGRIGITLHEGGSTRSLWFGG